jgi:hypothetical protein
VHGPCRGHAFVGRSPPAQQFDAGDDATDGPIDVHKNGRLVVEAINGQDMMAWVTQGDISDRTTERLGTSGNI